MTVSQGAPRPGGISIHAVDVAHGVPAAGLAVRLRRIEPMPCVLAEGACGPDGHFALPASTVQDLVRGDYDVEFAVADFYRASGVALPRPPFVGVAVFRFGIDRLQEHFHLPLKFTPWGFSLFRGGS